ncbi:MAG: ABC transporter permease [Phycisphaerales bacterium]
MGQPSNPTRSVWSRLCSDRRAIIGGAVLLAILLLCTLTLPFTLGADASGPDAGVPRFNAGTSASARTPPALSLFGLLGTDDLGRSLLYRCLAGGGISLTIGALATVVSVGIGTVYGAIAGYAGGRTDAVLMRVVDLLYGLPYVLLVVLLAVAADAMVDESVSRTRARAALTLELARASDPTLAPLPDRAVHARIAADPTLAASLAKTALVQLPPRELSPASRTAVDLATLLVAISGVSWLTTARVIRGQVLSLKAQPFVEAARAVGASNYRIFLRHLLPNLVAPIVVYATLTVPQAILQESFLSFLGIGVKPPLPSWGSLAARGVEELNPYRSDWWLLLFPCLLLGSTLLALNFMGEALRDAIDPRSTQRGSEAPASANRA